MAAKTKAKPKAVPPITILVDPHYIGTATRSDGAHCMVANAVREQLDVREGIQIFVDGSTVDMTDENGKKIFSEKLPAATGKKIADWDRRVDPLPFTVQLSVSDELREKMQGK